MTEYIEGGTEDIWANDAAIQSTQKKRDYIHERLAAAAVTYSNATSPLSRFLRRIPVMAQGAHLAAEQIRLEEMEQFLVPNSSENHVTTSNVSDS